MVHNFEAAKQPHFANGWFVMIFKNETERLKEEVARLTAALEDANFECQRLEIVNSNLDFIVKESQRELTQNISLLQSLEEENEQLKNTIEKMKQNGI